jgi:hypothetical protein
VAVEISVTHPWLCIDCCKDYVTLLLYFAMPD